VAHAEAREKAIRMLRIHLNLCKQTQASLQDTANVLDEALLDDLSKMIERTEVELAALEAS
jgi:hypothetical protein